MLSCRPFRFVANHVRSIISAAQRTGTAIHLLRPLQVLTFAAAVHAANHNVVNAVQQDLLPHRALPPLRVNPTYLSRDYHADSQAVTGMITDSQLWTSVIAESQHNTARIAILHGATDGIPDWLRAGQALSAAQLSAADISMSVLAFPLTTTESTRGHLHHLLPGASNPYIALRLST